MTKKTRHLKTMNSRILFLLEKLEESRPKGLHPNQNYRFWNVCKKTICLPGALAVSNPSLWGWGWNSDASSCEDWLLKKCLKSLMVTTWKCGSWCYRLCLWPIFFCWWPRLRRKCEDFYEPIDEKPSTVLSDTHCTVVGLCSRLL